MYEIFEKLCAKRGITPYKFCKDSGVNSSTISTWKKNESLARPDLAKKVCDYFGITLDYLMGSSFVEEMGHVIQEERINQGISQGELAQLVGIPDTDLYNYEVLDEPIREDIFDDIASALGTDYFTLLAKYDLYDDYIPPQFDGDIAKFEAFKKARDKDAMNEDLSKVVAKNDTERRLIMLCRKAGDVSDDDKDDIVNLFESTIDLYLKAKGIKKE
ncbi:helix-turn-helix transcriptional regulator [Clostridium sp. KNHs205]|uniref:helix-turn-helix transcriptional regulator n=1 Tax=Clostridium sp. KNHs205 TaxID=1449050 RepID=UPI00068DD742|nr:helix-turn-helix transcriptional regulator [Clostridium sp. KNHs205]